MKLYTIKNPTKAGNKQILNGYLSLNGKVCIYPIKHAHAVSEMYGGTPEPVQDCTCNEELIFI